MVGKYVHMIVYRYIYLCRFGPRGLETGRPTVKQAGMYSVHPTNKVRHHGQNSCLTVSGPVYLSVYVFSKKYIHK